MFFHDVCGGVADTVLDDVVCDAVVDVCVVASEYEVVVGVALYVDGNVVDVGVDVVHDHVVFCCLWLFMVCYA